MSSTTAHRPRPLPAVSGRLRGIVRGDTRDAAWARPALIALLAITAIAYLWDLSASGNANSFYAAAVQAGTKSWKAFFFGSLDSSSFITVDKPPASLWVMELSGRVFGFSSASMLIPSVVEGVAAVALLYAAVKRWFGAGAGLLAGLMLAVTPVAALMFRFNNPDALLVMLMVAGAYCVVRAVERGSTRWLLAAGTMIGFAFLAKMMQAFLVLPAFALVYMVAAPTGIRRRLMQVLAAGMAVVVSAGWWVAIVALWPVGSRPLIDGSPDNNIFNLITGYNGLGRIFGASGGGGGGGGGGGNFSGAAGPLRLFNSLMGGQASWLLPAALICLVGGLWVSRRAPRTDRTRAALLLWGGWLVVTALVFSYGSGVIHTYYTVALAPAIAALVAIGAARLWHARDGAAARVTMALIVTVTAAWAWVLLDRTPNWEPWVRWLVVVSAVAAVAGLLAAPWLHRLDRRVLPAVAVAAIVACLAGPAAYAAQTLTTAHTGAIPSAGPSSGSGFGGGGGPPGAAPIGSQGSGASAAGGSAGGGPAAGASAAGGSAARGKGASGKAAGGMGAGGQTQTSAALVTALKGGAGRYRWVAAVSGSQSAASLELATGGDPVMAIGGFNGEGGHLSLAQFKRYVAAGEIHYYIGSTGLGGLGAGGGRPGSAGVSSTTGGAPSTTGGAPSTTGGAPSTTGGAPSGVGGPPNGVGPATGGSAAGGTGARPAGAGFPAGAGRPGTGAAGPGGYSASSITSWVKAHYKSDTIGGETVYDLSTPK
jgi:4-amino-4-deoxy-L-arabinose transferase-like glycosyltransferase